MKKLLILLVLVVVVLFAGVWFAGDILQKGVEEGGTWALGTETSLSSASLSVVGGQVSMKDLKVKNPEGFKADEAVSFGLIDVKANMGSLMSDTMEVEHIDIGSPTITLEITTGGTNLGALMDHLKAKTGGGGETPKPEPEEEESGKPGKKLKIGRVTITEPKVILAQSMLMSTQQEISLPTLELTDIGGGDSGESKAVTLPELIEEILGSIMAAVAKSKALPGDLQNILNGEVAAEYMNKVKDQLGDLEGAVGGALEEATEGLGKEAEAAKEKVEEGLGGLKEGLGGLLGGDKKDK